MNSLLYSVIVRIYCSVQKDTIITLLKHNCNKTLLYCSFIVVILQSHCNFANRSILTVVYGHIVG